MRIDYKNNRLERVLIAVNALTAAMVAATFILLFGFDSPLLSAWILYTVQVILLCVFVAEKIFRLFNSASKIQFLRTNWFEIPLLLFLFITIIGASHWFARMEINASEVRHFTVGIYLVLQVVIKLCRTSVSLC